MTLAGPKTRKLSHEQEGVLAYLLEVARTASLLRLEDAQGREVPATFKAITEEEVELTSERPLQLEARAGTHLVFVLHDLRYKAPTTVLALADGTITLALPARLELAERRKRTRGYLNFALLGLFSPLAAATPAEPSSTFIYETVQTSSAKDGGRDQAQPFRVEGLGRAAAPSSNLLVSFMHEWVQAHPLNPTVHGPVNRFNPAPLPNTFRQKHRGPLAHGVTYNFLSLSLPNRVQEAFNLSSMKFETHLDRNNIRLGIRFK